MTTEERIEEILAMRGVDARNSIRKEENVDVLKALLGTDGVEARETRILVLKPAQSRLTALEKADEPVAEKPAKAPKAAKTPKAKKAPKAAKTSTPRSTPEGGPTGTKTCPNCSTTGDIASLFGYRRMKTMTKAGEKIRVAAQSQCRPCRGKKTKKEAGDIAA